MATSLPELVLLAHSRTVVLAIPSFLFCIINFPVLNHTFQHTKKIFLTFKKKNHFGSYFSLLLLPHFSASLSSVASQQSYQYLLLPVLFLLFFPKVLALRLFSLGSLVTSMAPSLVVSSQYSSLLTY